ncbi:MAG: SRPBCC domain-containing protein [Bacteroidia bacterium]|jgi:activator of HSP90 ATPase|nr:SRPBCC domain-containing protein [Bacteroidia bacterium]
MHTTDIHQQLVFATDAIDLYDCLMDERKHSSFTADVASIEDKVGSAFSALSGYIEETNLELERGLKIVQRWRANEPEWPVNHFSELVIRLENTPAGCKLELRHNGIPLLLADKIAAGWHQYYWEPLSIYLNR